MEKTLVTLGLSMIEVGEASTEGVMPTEMAKIGKTYKDTCKINQDEAERTEHYEEGNSTPVVIIKSKKVPKINFSIMDPDPTMLATYVGGRVTNDGKRWGYSGTGVVANKAITLHSKYGLDMSIPNADIEATLNGDFSDKGIFLVDFIVTPTAVNSEENDAFYADAKDDGASTGA